MGKLFRYFLFLGATGFGGPLSLIQQMRQYFVEKTNFIQGAKFDQAFTLIKAMPGPIAFQMAVFCGQHLFGRLAGFLFGFALVLPSFLMMIGIGISYQYLKSNFYVLTILNGFQFAVAAILLWSLRNFFIQFYKLISFWIILTIAGILYFNKLIPEPLIIIGFGLLMVGISSFPNRSFKFLTLAPVFFGSEKLWPLFKVCSYGGAVVFGTGLALIPVLQNQFVAQFHWLDLQTFNDGVTFGQMTPGPVTITATFLGFKVAGLLGALVATIGVFLLPMFHMLTWFPYVLNWLSKQKWIPEFILGATAAVVGILLITIFNLNRIFLSSSSFWIVFFGSFLFIIYRPKTQLLLVILSGGILNLILSLILRLILNSASMNSV